MSDDMRSSYHVLFRSSAETNHPPNLDIDFLAVPHDPYGESEKDYYVYASEEIPKWTELVIPDQFLLPPPEVDNLKVLRQSSGSAEVLISLYGLPDRYAVLDGSRKKSNLTNRRSRQRGRRIEKKKRNSLIYRLFHNTPRVQQTHVPRGEDDRARRTVPPDYVIRSSAIPGAGDGVFYRGQAVVARESVLYGPYEGVFTADNPNNGRSWTIFNTHPRNVPREGSNEEEEKEPTKFYIDAYDDRVANWLSFVNTASSYREANIGAVSVGRARESHKCLVTYTKEWRDTYGINSAGVNTLYAVLDHRVDRVH
ncbi:histone-lysine N-methyltransferase PRDM9 [Aphelenchoides avenae]|nr:histone-lysine N-methyltransferase PRDM9 [Aphelenchus avenae]